MNYLIKGTLGYFNEKLFNITAGLTLIPGLYYTPVVNNHYDEEISNYRPIYGEINSSKYKPYSYIDLSINKIVQYKNSNFVFFYNIDKRPQ